MPRVMRRAAALRFVTALAVPVFLCSLAAQAPRASEPATVVVELFTSEGCESCPPADALLRELVSAPPLGAHIVALGEHVDYWDALGWKDRFSSTALTNRQRAYAKAFRTESIYTPQMFVDGRTELVGSDVATARKAIRQAVTRPHGVVRMTLEPLSGGRIAVAVTSQDLPAPGRGDRDTVVVALTEDSLSSDVLRGENHGLKLQHAAVVHQMTEIGDATAQPSRIEIAIDPAWRRDRVKIVAFVQESQSRRIVGATSVGLSGSRP